MAKSRFDRLQVHALSIQVNGVVFSAAIFLLAMMFGIPTGMEIHDINAAYYGWLYVSAGIMIVSCFTFFGCLWGVIKLLSEMAS